MRRPPHGRHVAVGCVLFIFGTLLASPAGAAARQSEGCDATVARITPGKAYRLWLDRRCREFRKLRAALGPLPDMSTPEAFVENGQDYADHEESIDRLLLKLSGELGSRPAPNKDTEKGVERWVDSFDAWYQATESLIGEIRQGSIDFDTFAQRTERIAALKANAKQLAKRLGLRECAWI